MSFNVDHPQTFPERTKPRENKTQAIVIVVALRQCPAKKSRILTAIIVIVGRSKKNERKARSEPMIY